jgi:hypothetical protein
MISAQHGVSRPNWGTAWAGMSLLLLTMRRFASVEERKSFLDTPARKDSQWLGTMTNPADIISVSYAFSRLKSGIACYHSAQNLLFSSLLLKNIKINVFFVDNAHLMYNAHPKLFRHSFFMYR